jgi:hypothetical protein
VAGLGDDERWARSNDLTCLSQDHLDASRIGVAGELAGASGRLDSSKVDNAALDLRNRLLRHDEHVVALQTARSSGRLDEEQAEIVALVELRDAQKRDDAKLARQPRPVTRIPACPL